MSEQFKQKIYLIMKIYTSIFKIFKKTQPILMIKDQIIKMKFLIYKIVRTNIIMEINTQDIIRMKTHIVPNMINF
jgi:hypothetical protein